ncbi:hypothetical protein GPECTOR_3g333 [Gonium pectorale]|uniref:Nodulin-like domain-containing protein n=1 Tax=Gonium pectorale TaxID=33097 RepID=A0A150GZY7_GONPE|nr:hypothetical protein GPECTOR_3g333 [Gonium pectorale]|eukprot:KXZ55188.1 hypothetical protein GPECTOR_3g333 [Gonium pectorale]
MRTRLYLNRWLTFTASCLLQVNGGLSYSFSIFAPALKELWGYRETQIAAVGSCFNFGGYLAIPAGVLYDRLEKHKRFGPRFVALIGVLALAAGYLGLYAAASGLVAPSFAFVCACAFLGGNSSTWFDTAAIVTNVRNFPHDRGTVVGILKAFVGLSASVYSSVYAAAFAPAAVGYLRFIATFPPLIVLGLLAVVNLVPAAYHETQPQPEPRQQQQPSAHGEAGAVAGEGKEGEGRRGGQGRSGSSGCRHGREAESPRGRHSSLEHSEQHTEEEGESEPEAEAKRRRRRRRHGGGGGGGGGGRDDEEQAAPLLAAERQPPPSPQPAATAGAAGTAPSATRFSSAARFTFAFTLVGVIALYQTAAALWAGAAHPGRPARQWLLGGLLCLLSTSLLLPVQSGNWVHRKPRPEAVERARRSLLGRIAAGGRAFSVGLGTGLSVLNNLGSIVVALGGQQGGQVVFVSLFSVANAIGRLLGGVLSESLLRRHGTPRTLCLLAASCLTLLGVGGAAASELPDLYGTCLVAGLAFGAHWGLIPAITSDLFGLTHFGSNYTGLQLGPAVGGYLLSTVLTGKLYDRAARRHGGELFCLGADCYFDTWCVLGGLNLLALLGTRELYGMSAPRYRRLVRGGGV